MSLDNLTDSKLKILMVSPEVVPFAKVGGLGDAVGSLTEELSRKGHDVRVVCPKYGFLQPDTKWEALNNPLIVNLGEGISEECLVWQTFFEASEGIVYFLQHDKYYDRPEIYSGPWGPHGDNDERFTFFSRAAIDLCYQLKWVPDIIHCHDWTTGLVPIYLNTVEKNKALGEVATVFTIHNLEHQGVFSKEVLKFSGLPQSVFKRDCLESMGQINMMKGGIYSATKLTTVSPTYAEEIQVPELGCGLNHVLAYRESDLLGIVNGIDRGIWDPRADVSLPANYGVDQLEGKAVCKQVLQKKMGLKVSSQTPIFAAVARLYHQKGLDLLADVIPDLMSDLEMQVVILGEGEGWLEDKFKEFSQIYAGRFASYIGYDGKLAHLFYAGADYFLMPSRFEPCGLSQLYAMAYGTPPIVRATGGLKDTVVPYSEGGQGTGIMFRGAKAGELSQAMRKAYDIYLNKPDEYNGLQVNGLSGDYSWSQSAQLYDSVYRDAVLLKRKEVLGVQKS